MSRFNDDYDEEFPGEVFLQMANTERSLAGRKGQAALRRLEAALLALPTKRLIQGTLSTKSGDVCAMGAFAKHEGVPLPAPADDELDEDWGYSEHTKAIAEQLRVPRPVGIEIAWMNDGGLEPFGREMTPEQRYEAMLTWVRSQLISPPARTPIP